MPILSDRVGAAVAARRPRGAAMSEQVCVCGHPFSIHRLHRQIGDRNECWATIVEQGAGLYCQCRQFQARREQQAASGAEVER